MHTTEEQAQNLGPQVPDYDREAELLQIKVLQQRKIAMGIYGAVLILFLFPFFNLSCKGITLFSVSGLDMVTGKSFSDLSHSIGDELSAMDGGYGIPPSPWAIIAFLCPILAIGVYLSKYVMRDATALALGVVGFLGLVALAIVGKLKADSKFPDLLDDEVKVKFGMGLVLAIVAAAVAVYFSNAVHKGHKLLTARKDSL